MTSASHTTPPSWAVTSQRWLLANIGANATEQLFVPCTDRHSKAAFHASLSDFWATAQHFAWLWPLLLLLSVPLTALVTLHWFWRRHRPQPGWLIDLHHLHIHGVGQKCPDTFTLTPDMGLLVHHRQIDITHPTRGPVLTLFKAAPSKDPQDALALENLGHVLSERLRLRWVGCRVALH